eukprot:Gb_04579 [translate_table: standard]
MEGDQSRQAGNGDCFTSANARSVEDDGPYFDMDLALPLHWCEDPLSNSKSSEEFEFRISVSRTPGVSNPVDLSPADDLFYKGQLLPLHRLQMVQNLSVEDDEKTSTATSVCKTNETKLADGSETSDSANSQSGGGFWSKDSNSDSTSSRDSSGSSHDSCFSNKDIERGSHPSSAQQTLITVEEKTHFPSLRKSAAKLKISLLGLRKSSKIGMDEKSQTDSHHHHHHQQQQQQRFTVKFKTMELPSISVFSRDSSKGTKSNRFPEKTYHSFSYSDGCASSRNMDTDRDKERIGNNSRSAKEVVQKYLRMVKPLYEKISQRYDHQGSFFGHLRMDECGNASAVENTIKSTTERRQSRSAHVSFPGNLRIGRRKSGVGSCPSSMHSSPSHSGILTGMYTSTSDSTMEELQNAIQGAIAHCKNSINNNNVETQKI